MNQTTVKNNIYEIFGKNGWEDFDGIVKTENNNIPLIDIFVNNENESIISCTPDHILYNEFDAKIRADFLKIGDLVKTKIGLKKISNLKQSNTNKVFDIINSDSHKIYSSKQTKTNNSILTHQCDEFAFVPGFQAEEFWAANYPTISASKQAKIIIISTPNGLFNIYHRIWSQAVNKLNTFHPTEVSWQEVPGRDQEWADEQLANLGEQKFNQEFAVKFIGSTSTLLNGETIKFLLKAWKNPVKRDLQDKLKIWKDPEEGCSYILGVDPAKGTGENWSVIQVLKIEKINPVKMEQVAVFRDNLTDVYTFAEICNRLSLYYNHAHIMCENNGEGSAVVQRIWWDHENENLVNSGSKEANLGIRSTRTTKPKAVLFMKKLIEDGCIKIFDKDTIEELGSYIEDNGKFFGKDKPDDLVSALFWGIYILEMDVLDESYGFIVKEESNDAWGILTDVNDGEMEEDWDWLNNSNVFD